MSSHLPRSSPAGPPTKSLMKRSSEALDEQTEAPTAHKSRHSAEATRAVAAIVKAILERRWECCLRSVLLAVAGVAASTISAWDQFLAASSRVDRREAPPADIHTATLLHQGCSNETTRGLLLQKLQTLTARTLSQLSVLLKSLQEAQKTKDYEKFLQQKNLHCWDRQHWIHELFMSDSNKETLERFVAKNIVCLGSEETLYGWFSKKMEAFSAEIAAEAATDRERTVSLLARATLDLLLQILPQAGQHKREATAYFTARDPREPQQLRECFKFAVQQLQRFCAPCRDAEVAALKDLSATAESLAKLIGVLQLAIFDTCAHWIEGIRDEVHRDVVRYERMFMSLDRALLASQLKPYSDGSDDYLRLLKRMYCDVVSGRLQQLVTLRFDFERLAQIGAALQDIARRAAIQTLSSAGAVSAIHEAEEGRGPVAVLMHQRAVAHCVDTVFGSVQAPSSSLRQFSTELETRIVKPMAKVLLLNSQIYAPIYRKLLLQK